MAGWCENLDLELKERELDVRCSSTKKRPAQDSALTNITDVTTFIEVNQQAPSSEEQASDTSYEDTDEVQKKLSPFEEACETFVERVGMAGLEDYHKTRIKPERVMWILAFLAAVAGIAFTSYNIIAQVMETTVVYDDFQKFGSLPPFPNITFCIPAANHKEKIREQLVIPEATIKFAKRQNLSLDDVIENFILEYWHTDFKNIEKKDPMMTKVGFQIIDATAPGNFTRVLISTEPTCEEILSNCQFEGQPFNCCDVSEFTLADGIVCYRMNLNGLPNFRTSAAVTGGSAQDAVKEDNSGLVVNATIDWNLVSFSKSEADDGFLVYIGQNYSVLSDPIAIPTDSNAVIKLAPSRHLLEKSDCHDASHIPKLQYYDEYDPYGVNCAVDLTARMTTSNCGCEIISLGRVPTEGAECPAEVYYQLMSVLNGNEMGSIELPSNAEEAWEKASNFFHASDDSRLMNIEKLFNQFQDVLHLLQNPAGILRSQCAPLCNRWIYPIISASYGYIHFRDQEAWHRQNESKSWSRIRIYYPEAYYRLHIEKPSAPKYTAVWDIGGVLGVYLGFSMVTLIQFMFYGLFLIYTAGCAERAIQDPK